MSAFFEQASAVARRLCRDAIWADGCCNWIGPSVESMNVWDVRHKSLGPDLYSGTSGVALFLASVAHLDPEPVVRKTAVGAANHAFNHAGAISPPFSIGVYTGTVGIAWSLTRIGELIENSTWLERGLALLDGIEPGVEAAGLDVMSGYAGAIPVMLELSRRFSRPAWTATAKRWGERLADCAEKSSEGWSWKTLNVRGQDSRNLTGFSHGAAGVGWAFTELFAATHESLFRDAAAEAFRYERSHYSAENENWPDFRDYLRAPGSAGTPIFGMAWCHGAPGIALSRLKAWRHIGEPLLREEAEAAVRTTKRALASPDAAITGFSLCHGCAGNADVLLEAERELNAPEMRLTAEQIGYTGIERFESRRLGWPCGVPGTGETPNLMLGTAGIGYFYLRLANQTLPTVLAIGSDINLPAAK